MALSGHTFDISSNINMLILHKSFGHDLCYISVCYRMKAVQVVQREIGYFLQKNLLNERRIIK